MALNSGFLCAGDQRKRVTYRSSHGDFSPSAVALAMVSGDSCLLARPQAVRPRPTPRQVVRQSIRIERLQSTGGSWSSLRFVKEVHPDGRSRSRSGRARFSPYPTPVFKRNLLRSV
ncbi:uncharacterized protein C11orf71 homolog [Artibeus jamaicensis]|uniref:uncharacterized protein C11orf71 homolog n=1 Tax=Artibeus jamaicensis TaxID=9417 RepID=UPI00235A826F|nr:uncharacterized protein C11orf71 homolog [Artibeus jamaicensis]